MKIRAIILGTTGMVGEGVLHECLKENDVEKILVINRRPCGVEHPKLREIIHQDFHNMTSLQDRLKGYNACYFCMGVSSVGMEKERYKQITYDLTMHVAQILMGLNPDMVFCYVSGAGTDSSEAGRAGWARIKGKTENDLLKFGFKDAYMFRPGYIQPIPGLKNTYKIYKILAPFYPLFKSLFPSYVGTMEELGRAMINVTRKGSDLKVLECKEIRKIAA